MNNIPLGADTKDAPWNQEDNPEREIEVLVSMTISKKVKIKVSDYKINGSGKDDDGDYFENIDYSECDLETAVHEQIVLPNNAYKYIGDDIEYFPKEYQDVKNWIVDDFEVILED